MVPSFFLWPKPSPPRNVHPSSYMAPTTWNPPLPCSPALTLVLSSSVSPATQLSPCRPRGGYSNHCFIRVLWLCSQTSKALHAPFLHEACLFLAWLKSKSNHQSLFYSCSLVSTPLFCFCFFSLCLFSLPHFFPALQQEPKLGGKCLTLSSQSLPGFTLMSSHLQPPLSSLPLDTWLQGADSSDSHPYNSHSRMFCSVFRPSHPTFKLDGSGSIMPF